jgi:type IV pilus assembly protein PilE
MERSAVFHMGRDARARESGVTLIELVVVMAVVAILAAVAFPSYAAFMKKSRRGDAEAALMDIAQREQQYLLDTRSYAPDGTLYGGATGSPIPVPADVSAYYTVTITVPGGAPPTFTATATPIAGSPQVGDYTLTLDSTGAKSPASVW